MSLFIHTIYNWSSWVKVSQSIEAFTPLVEYIYKIEKLPFEQIENLHPGTNAVFKVGNTVCKIFAPKESGMDAQSDFNTELFSLKRANLFGISAPILITNGIIHDKYDFFYLIMEFVDGKLIDEIEDELNYFDKEEIGRKLRKITDKINTSCECFNYCNVVERGLVNKKWHKFSDSFNKERLAYLCNLKNEKLVYVHGDLNPSNILFDIDKNLYIIDFADALLAPAEYELVSICGFFDYNSVYLRGYFGADYCPKEIAEMYFKGVLLHDYGADIILNNFCKPYELMSLDILRKRIYDIFNK